MNKFKWKLFAVFILLSSIFLLPSFKKEEKTPPINTITEEEKVVILDSFAHEYKLSNIFNSTTINIEELIDFSHDYYDAEKLIVEVNNSFEYLGETKIYEIFCDYDKKLKRWQYAGSQCLDTKEKLDILGEWEFEVFPGFFQKGFNGYMHIVEMKDNKAKIFVVAENDDDIYFGDEYWYDIYVIGEDKPINEREYTIRDIVAIDYENKRYKNIVYNMNITINDAEAYNQIYYERSKMERISTDYKRQAAIREIEEKLGRKIDNSATTQ